MSFVLFLYQIYYRGKRMSRMKAIEGLILFIVVDNIHWSTATICGINQITVEQNQSEHCLDCVECPAGMGSIPQCGSFFKRNVTVTCKACVKGVSYSESRDHTSCKSCRICVENEKVIRKCSPTSDTQCGSCKPGYYRSFVYSCEKCSRCCEDTAGHDVEPQCLRQGFPRDRACQYTGRNCEGLRPTLAANIILANTTTTTKKEKHKFPLPYIIGAVAFMLAVLVLAVVALILFGRVYCDAKRNTPRMQSIQLEEQYDNNNGHLSSQVELEKSLVGQSRL